MVMLKGFALSRTVVSLLEIGRHPMTLFTISVCLTVNYIMFFLIEWSSWEAWTACSVTCGSGVHVRYRACNKIDSTEADCEGQYVQPAVCTVDECPGKTFSIKA